MRFYQFLLMLTLLFMGVEFKGFSINFFQILLTFISCNLTQFFWLKIFHLEEKGFLSSFITSMGLSLLLRSDTYWVHPLVGFLAISSKFLIRFSNRHIFNPAMLGVVLGVSFFPAWISLGQWGQGIWISGILILFGLWVSWKAGMGITSTSFLLTHFSFLLYRIWYYGYEWSIFFHQIQNGSLLLFAFFMITDPKTSPLSLIGKLLHCFFVCILAYHLQFSFYIQGSLIWSLFVMSPLVIFLDRFKTQKKYLLKSL